MSKSRNTSPGVTVWNITQVELWSTVHRLDCRSRLCDSCNRLYDHDIHQIHLWNRLLLPSTVECDYPDLPVRLVHSEQFYRTFIMRFDHNLAG